MSIRKLWEFISGKTLRKLREELKLLELDYENLEFINKKVHENLDYERKINEELNNLINDLAYKNMLDREELKEKVLIERETFYKAEEESQSYILKEDQLKDKIKTLNKQIRLALKEIDFLINVKKNLLVEIEKIKQEKEQNKWDFMQLEDWIKKGYQEIIIDVK